LSLDKKTQVIWCSEGSCDVEKAKNLRDFIASLLGNWNWLIL